ncbi:MAG TPA: carboxypeptidase-like regulatory domain-containing protein, partial [Candidatus Methanoperedens sp.]|nr:carboxypeptidase-like regulatory domain-containing protein [Candidatus Methanoperedens sp.]
SQVKNATLTIQSFSYINGTVTNASVPIPGVYVSTTGANYTTGSDGNYSLSVPEGNYVVNAIKQPEFYDYTISGVVLNPSDTTIRDINLIRKPNGTISGVVTN